MEEEEPVVFQESWNVYPNPVAGGDLNLPTTGVQGNVEVEVYDLAGRRWMQEAFTMTGERQLTLDVNDLAPGHYVVRMVQGGQSRAAKFVVRR